MLSVRLPSAATVSTSRLSVAHANSLHGPALGLQLLQGGPRALKSRRPLPGVTAACLGGSGCGRAAASRCGPSGACPGPHLGWPWELADNLHTHLPPPPPGDFSRDSLDLPAPGSAPGEHVRTLLGVCFASEHLQFPALLTPAYIALARPLPFWDFRGDGECAPFVPDLAARSLQCYTTQPRTRHLLLKEPLPDPGP